MWHVDAMFDFRMKHDSYLFLFFTESAFAGV